MITSILSVKFSNWWGDWKTTVGGWVLKSFSLAFDRVPTDKIKSCLISSTRYVVSWTIAAVDKLLEHRSELFKKGFTIYYFAKRDADKKICEMITRLSVLLIFSDIFGTKTWRGGGGEVRHPNFLSGGAIRLPCYATYAYSPALEIHNFIE